MILGGCPSRHLSPPAGRGLTLVTNGCSAATICGSAGRVEPGWGCVESGHWWCPVNVMGWPAWCVLAESGQKVQHHLQPFLADSGGDAGGVFPKPSAGIDPILR